MTAPLLQAEALHRIFHVGRATVPALRGVDLDLSRGEIVAVVGESGSGKSTLGNLVLGLDRADSGTIRLDGQALPRRWPGAMRRRIQLVAQNPMLALNPRRSVLQSVALPLHVHGLVPRRQERQRAAELLELVGLPPAMLDRMPRMLSGGQRQRVALARALAAEPDILVLDEPTSALDVSVQARVLQLLQDLQTRLSLSYLFITHDLAVVRLLAHRVVVLLRGVVVESGPTLSVFTQPRHRYTQMLLASIPVVSAAEQHAKPEWPWDRTTAPELAPASGGCPFRTRCPYAVADCAAVEPMLTPIAPGHQARCHNPAQPAEPSA